MRALVVVAIVLGVLAAAGGWALAVTALIPGLLGMVVSMLGGWIIGGFGGKLIADLCL